MKDMQYSRNLGTGNGIELVKIPAGQAMTVSIPAPAPVGANVAANQ
jgi:hypothetical protein